MQKIIINGVEVDLDSLKKATGEFGEKTETITKSLSGNTLSVSDVNADVNIKPTDAKAITVSVTGLKSLIKDVIVKEKNESVIIKGKGTSARGGSSTIIQSGGGTVISTSGRGVSVIGSVHGSTIISGNNIIISDGDWDKMTIDVELPTGTTLEFSGVNGDISIGDTRSDLRTILSGSGSVRAVSVKTFDGFVSGSGDIDIERITDGASVRVTGSGDFTAGSVSGNVVLKISGSSNANIKSGRIKKLEVSVSGSGDVRVNTTAQKADLWVSGSGDIYVAHVIERPRKNVSGSGDVKIGRIG